MLLYGFIFMFLLYMIGIECLEILKFVLKEEKCFFNSIYIFDN